MKLNFWQILGIVIVVIGIVWMIVDRTKKRSTTQPSDTATPSVTPR